MAAKTEIGGGHQGFPWRLVGWSIPALLLLLLLAAMQFTDQVNWTLSDFVFAGILFGSVGLAFELITRKSASLAYRAGAAIAVVAAFLTIWVNGAVGMIGSEGNPHNLLFGAVLFLALIGSILARFQPGGMARAMVVAAIAQGVISALGLSADLRGAVLSLLFMGPWLLAAALLHNAAREQKAEASS